MGSETPETELYSPERQNWQFAEPGEGENRPVVGYIGEQMDRIDEC
jgi:hypothetical protein